MAPNTGSAALASRLSTRSAGDADTNPHLSLYSPGLGVVDKLLSKRRFGRPRPTVQIPDETAQISCQNRSLHVRQDVRTPEPCDACRIASVSSSSRPSSANCNLKEPQLHSMNTPLRSEGFCPKQAQPKQSPLHVKRIDRCFEVVKRDTMQTLKSVYAETYLTDNDLAFDCSSEEVPWRDAMRVALSEKIYDPLDAWGTGKRNSRHLSHKLPTQFTPPQLPVPLPPPSNGRGPLSFSSAFESGNLCAVWHSEVDEDATGCDAAYDMVMQPDSLSRGHVQWFYFAADCFQNFEQDRSPRSRRRSSGKQLQPPKYVKSAPVTVRMRLMNFRKDKSMFADGLAPAVWDPAHKSWRHDLAKISTGDQAH